MSSIPNIEIKILGLFEKRDSSAIKLIHDAYGRALYGVIFKILGKAEDTEEVLQDVLVKIWEKSSLYDSSKGRLYTWMLNIARNTTIDKTRTKLHKQNSKTDSQDDYVHLDRSSMELKPENIGVKDLTNILKADQKEIIELAYFQGYTQQEISEKLDIPIGTVKTKVRTALLFLKDYLKNEY
ncbi:MAG: sigma-70 family RNA polymerase sigma factor [Chitinophagales bacterium]